MSNACGKYVQCIDRFKSTILLLWAFLVVVALCLGALRFPQQTNNTIIPTHGIPGHSEYIKFKKAYPAKSLDMQWIVLISCESCYITAVPWAPRVQKEIEAFTNDWMNHNGVPNLVKRIEGYGSYSHSNISLSVAKTFVSSTDNAAIIRIDVSSDTKQYKRFEFYNHMRSHLDSIQFTLPQPVYIGITGLDPVGAEVAETLLGNLIHSDMICIPISFLILGFMISSWRLLLIVLLNLGIVIIVSFGTMAVVSEQSLPPNSITPQFMQTMALALCVDYSLFLFSRLRLSLAHIQTSPQHIIAHTLEHVGHVVVMSGSILVLAFLGLFYMKAAVVTQMGLGTSVVIFYCVFVNMTLTPSLLLTFFPFFSSFLSLDWSCVRRAFHRQPHDGKEDTLLPRTKRETSLSESMISFPSNIIIMTSLLAASLAFAYFAFQLNSSDDMMLSVDPSLQSITTSERVSRAFGPGLSQPFEIMVAPKNQEQRILSQEYFNAVQQIIEAIQERPVLCDFISTLESIAFSSSMGEIQAATARHLLHKNNTIEAGFSYAYMWQRQVDAFHSSSLITMFPSFNPNGIESVKFIHALRSMLKQKQLPDYDLLLVGPKVFENDVTAYTRVHLVGMAGVVLGGVLLAMGLMFRSCSVPIRLLFTLVLPLSAVYGLAVLVFQYGIFSWTHIAAFEQVEGFYWEIPIITLCICIGLALDYDIFLMARIEEFRFKGYTDHTSIVKALGETRGIISAAGIIMAVAFSNLLFQKPKAFIQSGWILVTAILIDTFIVRTILVPCIMSVASRYVWWPRKPPVPHRMLGIDGMEA